MKYIALMSALFLAGCCSFSSANQQETMYPLSSALTKLSSSVEAETRYGNPDAATDNTLLVAATAHDPALLAPFKDYKMKAKSVEGHSLILVCSADGRQALLEDAGCTAKMDKHHWQEKANPGCNYTIDMAQVCR
ncbi:hypothetical protein V6M93_02085 [Pectobacterium brasiliense]|uniref:hypothetical protein n=1 Tax=Pectobacterium TaxID=122277 RepID=UPI00027E09E2|nr:MULTISPECIES: hypothetical protein [Pectobacterium]GKW00889.1 hypothetical protein PEC301653_39340 [Pectobacterium carotovorum subsp. carotovorum]AFR01503.1 hypothetical protein PCC21_001000 [Pectobacterium carotovorum subsp. carotovorum PCC21]KFF70111.1 hypothetical protein IW00_04925 [Pectobacterium brasiliense]KHS88493.1 hypothetical protein RC83_07970 [Pectobacterium brasiliense]MBA0214572.1 hypothetical protein [Pectobacterium brasiliense]